MVRRLACCECGTKEEVTYHDGVPYCEDCAFEFCPCEECMLDREDYEYRDGEEYEYEQSGAMGYLRW